MVRTGGFEPPAFGTGILNRGISLNYITILKINQIIVLASVFAYFLFNEITCN